MTLLGSLKTQSSNHVKLIQLGRHDTRGPRVLGSQVQYQLEVNFFAQIILLFTKKQYKNANITNVQLVMTY